jgi:hypothetical protein
MAEVLALVHLVAEKSPAAVLIASTRHNKEVAGRLAVKTNSGLPHTETPGPQDSESSRSPRDSMSSRLAE